MLNYTMLQTIVAFFTISKLLFIISTFTCTWLLSTFNIVDHIIKVSNFTLSALTVRWLEVIFSLIVIIVCSYFFTFIGKKYIEHKRKKNQKKPIESMRYLDDINDNLTKSTISSVDPSKVLSSDNSVYLTKFKLSGSIIYLMHVLYGLYSYYRDPINMFFLTIAFLQVNIYWDFRSTIPLSIFSLLAIYQHMKEIMMSIRQQLAINNELTFKSDSNKILSPIMQKDLKRGNFIKLLYNNNIPADILLLGKQQVTINELDLTGENLDIPKYGLDVDMDNLKECILKITHYKNEGYVELDNKKYYYNSDNIIFRGTKLVDTDENGIFGTVIEVGNDCQIYRLDYELTKNKTPVEKLMNEICVYNLYLLALISALCVIIVLHKANQEFEVSSIVKNVITFILLFNTMIPLSLQIFFNVSSSILSTRLEKEFNIKVNSHGVRVFQHNPDECIIVSDKTGTLTTNKIEIKHYWCNSTDLMNEESIKEMTDLKLVDMFTNLISCSTINLNMHTKQILKSDILEEQMLQFITKHDCKLESNFVDETGGKVIFSVKDKKYIIERCYYKSYIHEYGVKVSILKATQLIENANKTYPPLPNSPTSEYFMHIQGMPEKIAEYLDNSKYDAYNDKLESIESDHNSTSYYKRIISHSVKQLSKDDVDNFMLKKDVKLYLNNFSDWSIYVFHDYVVDGIYDVIKPLKNKMIMLTGDKQSSAIYVGRTIGMLDSTNYTLFNKNNLSQINYDECLVISGKELEEMINNKNNKFKGIVDMINRIIIYRATPNIKQLCVSYLQKSFRVPVAMIGDGSNDVSSIMKADIGIGVKGENQTVQKVADIVIDNWLVIPKILNDFKKKRTIVENVCQWVIMKHMLTSFTLFGMLITSFYERVRDPTSPYLMGLTNMILSLYMMYYSYFEQSTILMSNKTYVHGILLGLLNGLYVFSNTDYNSGIYLAVASIVMQLVLRLQSVDSNKSAINKMFYCLSCLFVIAILYTISNISAEMFFSYLLLSGVMYYLVDIKIN